MLVKNWISSGVVLTAQCKGSEGGRAEGKCSTRGAGSAWPPAENTLCSEDGQSRRLYTGRSQTSQSRLRQLYRILTCSSFSIAEGFFSIALWITDVYSGMTKRVSRASCTHTGIHHLSAADALTVLNISLLILTFFSPLKNPQNRTAKQLKLSTRESSSQPGLREQLYFCTNFVTNRHLAKSDGWSEYIHKGQLLLECNLWRFLWRW